MKSKHIITSCLLTLSSFSLAHNLEFSGEVVANYTSENKTELADAILNINHKKDDNWSGGIVIKRSGEGADPDDIILDEAMINFDYENFSASIGRIGVPFGAYETNMITDPLTKGITDADKGAKDLLMLGAELNGLSASIYSYKDTDNDSGITLGYETEFDDGSFGIGVDYFNDGTDGFDNSTAMRLMASFGDINAYYENVKTSQNNSDTKASHFEIGYSHSISGINASLDIAYSKVNDGDKQTGLTYSIYPVDGITIAIESNDLDSENDRTNTLKVAYEF